MTDATPPDQAFRAWMTPHGIIRLRSAPDLRITGTLAAAAMTAVLARYAVHYNRKRPHRSLHLRSPRPDVPVPEPISARIKQRPILGGLINEYEAVAGLPDGASVLVFVTRHEPQSWRIVAATNVTESTPPPR